MTTTHIPEDVIALVRAINEANEARTVLVQQVMADSFAPFCVKQIAHWIHSQSISIETADALIKNLVEYDNTKRAWQRVVAAMQYNALMALSDPNVDIVVKEAATCIMDLDDESVMHIVFKEHESASLFVGNISKAVNANELTQAFNLFGAPDVKLMYNSRKMSERRMRHRNYAFVTFNSPIAAAIARCALNKKNLKVLCRCDNWKGLIVEVSTSRCS